MTSFFGSILSFPTRVSEIATSDSYLLHVCFPTSLSVCLSVSVEQLGSQLTDRHEI